MKSSNHKKIDYNKWAYKQLAKSSRESILLWKAGCLAALVPEGLDFKSALEIGCAEGILINRLKKLLDINTCYGIDISEVFLSKGKKMFPDISFIKTDSNKIPFKDKSIDLIILSDIIEHIPDIYGFLKEVKRAGRAVMLKVPIEKYIWRRLVSEPFGRSVLIGKEHPDGHLHAFSRRSVRRLMGAMGFRRITEKIVYYHNHDYTQMNDVLLKLRWFLDYKLKQILPEYAHILIGGHYTGLFRTDY